MPVNRRQFGGNRLIRVLFAGLPRGHRRGLERRSQVMVDKIRTLRRDRIRERIGRIGLAQMQAVESAQRLWLRL
jgi:mRNA-degrading endonuclease toxin of MazEF toxin-antitoxin module